MGQTIYVTIDDKKRAESRVSHYLTRDDALFRELNQDGYGVYWSVNEFNATRAVEHCTKLRYVYGDLDVAKAQGGASRGQKEALKSRLLEALYNKCVPTMIIDTSNGLQPLWMISDSEPTEANKTLYKKVIKGIIKWSLDYGALGDSVHDVSRILRLPGYYHQKEEPYLCELIHKADVCYSLQELADLFAIDETPEIKPLVNSNANPVFQAIEELDFKELITKAFASVGRPVTFDHSGRMIDPVGGTTGTFIGRKGNRDYLASSSHEPFQGNRVTAVADILKVSYSDAYQWICKEYNLNLQDQYKKAELIKIKEMPVKKDYRLRYTWGTRGLDTSFAIIKRGNFILIAAPSGSGKTTYSFDMACKNAKIGHKTIYFSLEMDEQEIKESIARSHSGMTIEEELDYAIPQQKQESFYKKIKEIESIPNLIIKSVRRDGSTDWNDIEKFIIEVGDVDLVFIDNLDLIAGRDKESDLDRQKRITRQVLNFTSLTQIPICLIHHYRKSQGKVEGLDGISGSGKIRDGADRIIKIQRCSDTVNEYPFKYQSTIFLQKGRGYPETSREIYFIKGTFVDIPPPETTGDTQLDLELNKLGHWSLIEKL
jgi:hypothetical protein